MVTVNGAMDATLDVRDRVAAGSGIVEFADKIWFHKTAAAVIDAGRCVRCGTCVAACPSNSIGVGTDGLPTLVRMCTGCSSCWDFCPLGGLRTERLQQLWEANGAVALPIAPSAATERRNGEEHSLAGHPLHRAPAQPATEGWEIESVGRVRATYVARARRRARGSQDGGVVTALLAALLRRGFVQGALLSHRQGPLRGETVLATTPEQVEQGAGSVYDQSYPLARLAGGLPRGIDEVALVGTPCQVAGLRALQLFPWRYRTAPADKVKLTIALFCTRSFAPDRLTLELVRRGMDLDQVARADIRDGWFRAFDGEGATVFETRVRDLRRAALRGCDECADFTGVMADIAVGNAGSPHGYTTVLIRTERGMEAWEQAAEALETVAQPDLAAVAAQAARNRDRAARAAVRGDERRLWLRYSEHLAASLGTDRAPVAPPDHRSHHYTVAC